MGRVLALKWLAGKIRMTSSQLRRRTGFWTEKWRRRVHDDGYLLDDVGGRDLGDKLLTEGELEAEDDLAGEELLEEVAGSR